MHRPTVLSGTRCVTAEYPDIVTVVTVLHGLLQYQHKDLMPDSRLCVRKYHPERIVWPCLSKTYTKTATVCFVITSWELECHKYDRKHSIMLYLKLVVGKNFFSSCGSLSLTSHPAIIL